MLKRRHARILFAAMFTWLVLSPYAAGLMTSWIPTTGPDNHFISAEVTIDDVPNLTYENGSLGEEIVWNATSDNPKNFTVTREGEIFDSGSWDGSLITVDLDHLYEDELITAFPAAFTFVCVVFDTDNETTSDEVLVTVIADILGPIIVATGNFSYEEGSFGHEVQWNITETNPQFFNITRESNEPTSNFTVIDSGDWAGNNISISVDGLNASKWYLYTLFVNDTVGYNSTSSVNVTVFSDLSDPTVTSPDDVEYEFGADENKIVWTVYDSNPANYTIEILILFNDTSYGNTSAIHSVPNNVSKTDWTITDPDGDDITFDVDDIPLGNYTFNITLYDIYGYHNTDSVNVTIYPDIRAPIITASDDFSYEEGYTGYSLNWSAEENNPRYYNLTRDGEVLLNDTWRGENLTILIDGMAVGSYVYNLTLIDFFNQTSFVVTIVQVTPDAHLPIISFIRVIESYTTSITNNISVQAYVWDLNNITSISIEWYTTDPTSSETLDMEFQGFDFFLSHLGEFSHGEVVHYQLTGQDNSSVQNIFETGWLEYEVTALRSGDTPSVIWISSLILGVLSILVILTIYFRTKTK
ncbi:MAG: hypothetical protein ACW97A_01860 [Candidatus Thorarchaeota archaeon]|jgi:hypothetical protein